MTEERMLPLRFDTEDSTTPLPYGQQAFIRAEATHSAYGETGSPRAQITVDQVAELLCRRLCDAAENM